MEVEKKISERLYFRIGDVAEIIGVKPYVLRYWETEFPIISPEKSHTGQRVYRRSDVENLMMIKHLLYEERYSIEGARKRINELRKKGSLKKFKQEKIVSDGESQGRFRKLSELCRELDQLARKPLSEIFQY